MRVKPEAGLVSAAVHQLMQQFFFNIINRNYVTLFFLSKNAERARGDYFV